MDYEKKYKEALKDMRVIYPNLRGDAKLAVEHAFPELAESEDERIRKRIRLCLDECVHSDIIRDYERDECLAYLEKQKEQQPAGWSEDDEKIRLNLMSLLVNMRGDRIREETYQKYYPWLKSLRPHWKPSEVCYGAKGDPDPAGVWKPSEEQIKALDKAIPVCMGVAGAEEVAPLESLYEQLKKL